MSRQTHYDFDVIILGGSISATITALTLNARNLRVAILDNGSHPRFALGESLLKPTVLWLQHLAEKYNLPELAILANVEKISTNIAPTSGVKKCFGFVQHEKDNPKVIDQWWSNVAVSYEEDVVEAHFYRQDIDAYLFRTATSRCEFVRSNANVEEITTSADGVKVSTCGDTLYAKFLLDCTGPTSKMAREQGLREQPCRYESRSWTLFTHMINVRPFDDCECAPQPALGWHDGTLHHILEDGWIWVIPFDNNSSSTNPIVSVGVTFDSTKKQKGDLSAAQEWNQLLQQYPAVLKQFEHAKTVRPWIGTGNLQYSATSSIGERFCLIGAAYGGIDALFSRGLLNTMQSISLVTDLLTTAFENDIFNTEQFEPLDKLQYNLLEINDRLTTGTYAAFGSSELTTWWLSVWTLVEQQSIEHAQNALESLQSDNEHNQATCICNETILLEVLKQATLTMKGYKAGRISESATRSALSNLSVKLAPLGYNYPMYSRLIKKLGFHPRSRKLLQTEHALVSIVDDLDNRLGLEKRLRTQPFVMCVIRHLSASTALEHTDTANANIEQSIDIEVECEDLINALLHTMNKWVKDTTIHTRIEEQVSLIRRIRYQETPINAHPIVAPSGLKPLLLGHIFMGQSSVWHGPGKTLDSNNLFITAQTCDRRLALTFEHNPALANHLGLNVQSDIQHYESAN